MNFRVGSVASSFDGLDSKSFPSLASSYPSPHFPPEPEGSAMCMKQNALFFTAVEVVWHFTVRHFNGVP